MQTASNTPAEGEYKDKSNNLSETDSGTHQTDSSTLINPHEGGTGPGTSPTDDCDPGNSGPHDSGGDGSVVPEESCRSGASLVDVPDLLLAFEQLQFVL